jgi:hypothetical protein
VGNRFGAATRTDQMNQTQFFLRRPMRGLGPFLTRVRYRLVPGIWYVLRVVADVIYGVQFWREELACSRS